MLIQLKLTPALHLRSHYIGVFQAERLESNTFRPKLFNWALSLLVGCMLVEFVPRYFFLDPKFRSLYHILSLYIYCRPISLHSIFEFWISEFTSNLEKNRVQNQLDLFSNLNLISTACVACKNKFRNQIDFSVF